MRIQRGCLLAAVGLCLLGGVTVFSETIDTGPAALSKSPTLGGIELPVVPNNHDRTSTSTEKSTSSKFFSTEASVPSRGRALDVSGPEPTNSLHANLTDLSDVSMDDEEDDRDNVQQDDKKIPQGGMVMVGDNSNMATTARTVEKMMGCVESGRNYSIGEQVKRGCEERCFCKDNGLVGDCEAVCTSPYVRTAASTNRKPDPYCKERLLPEEECCAILICENADSASLEADESCVFNNKTVPRGERIEDGCSKVCVCEAAGSLKCQPRCPPNETAIANQHDRCVVLTDPSDACCTITLCDVTLGDHEIRPETSGELTVNLTDVKVVNSTAIKLKLSSKSPRDALIEISDDNHVWREVSFDKAGIIGSLEPAHSYYVRVTESGKVGPAIRVFLPPEVTKTNASLTEKLDKNSCLYRNKTYKIGEEWYDECISFCQCAHNGQPECITIECPTDSGLDVLDPHCLDWETVPANFEPKPPHCCPQEVRCRNNGSCMYEGRSYDNWSELPKNVTGCEKRCYCEWGKITCDAACPPVKALPPATLNCPPFRAALMPLPGDDCCKQWACVEGKNASIAFAGSSESEEYSGKIEPMRMRNDSGLIGDVTRSPESAEHEIFHYPMDPGHPTVPYNGPYNPDYRPTRPTVEDVFHLPASHVMEKLPKDKSKSKTDSKKPFEPTKPVKEVTDGYFLGPFAPDKFFDKTTEGKPSLVPGRPAPSGENSSNSPNNLPSLNNKDQQSHFPAPPGPVVESHPPFAVYRPAGQSGANQEDYNVRFQDMVPPARPGTHDPNVILPPVLVNVPKKKTPDTLYDLKSKTDSSRPKAPPRNPEQDILPEELYHLVNLHPGLTHLNNAPPQGHPGLYEIHRQITGEKPTNQLAPDYSKKPLKTHVFAQKNENGGTTYHVHTPEIPNSPQQIEELLAHISEHDSNSGPFQRYPGQNPIPHNQPAGLPIHINGHLPTQLGFPPQNHPFAVQTPNQSGLDHSGGGGFLSGGLGPFPVQQGNSDEVIVNTLDALDEDTVRLVFTVPAILVGLHGTVELRYTSDKANVDPSSWKVQVFAPPKNLITTQQLEFELGDLKPSTEYKVKITVKLQDLENTPTSKIYSVRTLDRRADVSTLPPQIPVDAELRISETNSTWINVVWRKFSEYELQFIDGVQLRFKELEGKVYAATPLIHRAVTNYAIENLRPDTIYEVGIDLIPFPGQTTELVSDKIIQITTATEPDPYSFDVKVEIKSIKATDVEVSWKGVPYPEDKYVNIYRAIYQSDSGKEDTSTFKIAKRDSPAKTVISDLKPGTRYRLWIEVYLTNGKIKKSNVQDFVTKPGVPSTHASQQAGKLATSPLHEGDYYGPLVIVAIVASLAILSTLILLMMLMKRRTSSKADISPRKTTSAYDNPSYKIELQQETMDL